MITGETTEEGQTESASESAVTEIAKNEVAEPWAPEPEKCKAPGLGKCKALRLEMQMPNQQMWEVNAIDEQ